MTDAYNEHVKKLHAKGTPAADNDFIDLPGGGFIHSSGVVMMVIRERPAEPELDGFVSDETTARMNAAMAEMTNPTPPAKSWRRS